MKPFALLLVCGVVFLSGCGSSVAEKVDPDEAQQALRTALEGWKEGKTNAELEAHPPSILMNDTDWRSGQRLVEYKMDESGQLNGRQMRWVVRLKLQDKEGRATDRKATYVIDTIPRIVIVRDVLAR